MGFLPFLTYSESVLRPKAYRTEQHMLLIDTACLPTYLPLYHQYSSTVPNKYRSPRQNIPRFPCYIGVFFVSLWWPEKTQQIHAQVHNICNSDKNLLSKMAQGVPLHSSCYSLLITPVRPPLTVVVSFLSSPVNNRFRPPSQLWSWVAVLARWPLSLALHLHAIVRRRIVWAGPIYRQAISRIDTRGAIIYSISVTRGRGRP